jgi:hypothetical protein
VLIYTAVRSSLLAFHLIIIICGTLYEWSVGCKDQCVEVKPTEIVEKIKRALQITRNSTGEPYIVKNKSPCFMKIWVR